TPGQVFSDPVRVAVGGRLVDRRGQQRHHGDLRLITLQRAAIGAYVVPPGDQRPQLRVVEIATEVDGTEARRGGQHLDCRLRLPGERVGRGGVDPEPADRDHRSRIDVGPAAAGGTGAGVTD